MAINIKVKKTLLLLQILGFSILTIFAQEERLNNDLLYAANSGDITGVKRFLEAGANPDAQDSIALIFAAYEGHIEIVKLLLEAKANPQGWESQALIEAAAKGHLEIVKLLLEAKADPNAQDSRALIRAIEESHSEMLQLLINHGGDSSVLSIIPIIHLLHDDNLEGLISMHKSRELDLSLPRAMKEILISGNYRFVKYLFNSVPELKDAYLIGVGFNKTRGAMTAKTLKILDSKIQANDNAYRVDLSLEIAQDEEIMKHFSGFINPGATDDSYLKINKPFTLDEMPDSKRMEYEKVYQQVITMAQEYDIPYLGLCAGAQHLVLNSAGSLKRVGHQGTIKVSFIPGNILHYLLLTTREKAQALSNCELDLIELNDAYAGHFYSGNKEDLGKGVKLAAVSEKDIPEAYSLGANKIGIQFHPEKLYSNADYPGLNRHKQLLDNVFGVFEGYHRSMQYAKKMGIDKEVARSAIRKVNEALVEHLESCGEIVEYKNRNLMRQFSDWIAGAKGPKEIHFWGKGQSIDYPSNVKIISLLPGVTPEDIAIMKDNGSRGSNLVIYFKDAHGKLTILDRLDGKHVTELLRLEFADGSVIELNPADEYQPDMSFPGEELVK